MRLLPRFLIILVVCLIATAVPATPAQAVCGGPSIELSPKSGAPGTEVTVAGGRFNAGTLIDIYYDGNGADDRVATGRVGSGGDFAINFTVPEGCAGSYRVRADVYPHTQDAYFTVKPGLTVSPEKGPVGTMVTVEGRGFARNEEGIELGYYLNGNHITVESNIIANGKGSWETSFQIPTSTRGEHKLDAEGAESQLYEVGDAVFTVIAEISTDKLSGVVGENIMMTGSRFLANERDIKILFDGEAVVTGVKADDEGDWEESFEVPEMPTGEYSITAEGERTRKEDLGELSFEIKPDIMLSPDEGHVGMDLTVTGRGFAADEDVNITYDYNRIGTVETNDKGSFNVSFSVPESRYGDRLVIAGYAGGNAANAIFTMESDPPPIPELISPPDGSRLGLRGKVTPTFEWSEVPDDSGVRYSLQIATSENVTDTGEFIAPIVSLGGLVENSYTFDETEALPYGNYYWIVQSIDGAENKSEWTAVHYFRVGLLPLWGFIVAIVTIVVLLVALIRTLLKRRSIYYDRW